MLGFDDTEHLHERSQLIVPDIFLLLNLVQDFITHEPRINCERGTRDADDLILISGQTPIKYFTLLRQSVMSKPVPPAGPELVCIIFANTKVLAYLFENHIALRKVFCVSYLISLSQIFLVKQQTTTQTDKPLVSIHPA